MARGIAQGTGALALRSKFNLVHWTKSGFGKVGAKKRPLKLATKGLDTLLKIRKFDAGRGQDL
jgi:hypothetical protein